MIRHKRIAVLAIALLGIGAACSGEGGPVVPFPQELAGRWETDAPAYAGRFLQLSSDELLIGTGPATVERYHLDRVHRLESGESILYTIEYSDDDGDEYDIGFYYDSQRGGSLRMRNQRDMVWRKAR